MRLSATLSMSILNGSYWRDFIFLLKIRPLERDEASEIMLSNSDVTEELPEPPGKQAQVPGRVDRTQARARSPPVLTSCSSQHLPLTPNYPSCDLSNQ